MLRCGVTGGRVRMGGSVVCRCLWKQCYDCKGGECVIWGSSSGNTARGVVGIARHHCSSRKGSRCGSNRGFLDGRCGRRFRGGSRSSRKEGLVVNLGLEEGILKEVGIYAERGQQASGKKWMILRHEPTGHGRPTLGVCEPDRQGDSFRLALANIRYRVPHPTPVRANIGRQFHLRDDCEHVRTMLGQPIPDIESAYGGQAPQTPQASLRSNLASTTASYIPPLDRA